MITTIRHKADALIHSIGHRLAERDFKKNRRGPYRDIYLRYAATERCKCGAGMAYHRGMGMDGAWVCSGLLKRTDRGLKHDAAKPMSMYEILPEGHPIAQGRTTRPYPENDTFAYLVTAAFILVVTFAAVRLTGQILRWW